jgi:DNA-binding transcriptional ArsR family regulator
MNTKKKILSYLSKHPSATGTELREHLEISRQALNVHLRVLIESGSVVKRGSTRNAQYLLPTQAPAPEIVSRALVLKGLDEGSVYDELATLLNLRSHLKPNVEAIVHYGFTEILNNAIEHSEADRCKIHLRLEAGTVSFEVRDGGVGTFFSIASKLNLEDEQAAMVELMKGKTTTMSETHTGEGIFFASKAADRFVLRSHRIQVEWNRSRNDVFVSQQRFIKGTGVRFLVQRGAMQRLESVFAKFAPEEYDFRFQKTALFVKLLQPDYVSRSEAKRLLANLERFREVVLDFKGVHSIGQGFADEIFRVFAKRHPELTISTKNTNPILEAMLRHVGKR